MEYTQDQFDTMRRVWRSTHERLESGSLTGIRSVRQLHNLVDAKLARYALTSPEHFLEMAERY